MLALTEGNNHMSVHDNVPLHLLSIRIDTLQWVYHMVVIIIIIITCYSSTPYQTGAQRWEPCHLYELSQRPSLDTT